MYGKRFSVSISFAICVNFGLQTARRIRRPVRSHLKKVYVRVPWCTLCTSNINNTPEYQVVNFADGGRSNDSGSTKWASLRVSPLWKVRLQRLTILLLLHTHARDTAGAVLRLYLNSKSSAPAHKRLVRLWPVCCVITRKYNVHLYFHVHIKRFFKFPNTVVLK